MDMSTLYRLIHNRMYVTVAFNESVKVKTALVSLKGRPPRSDTKGELMRMKMSPVQKRKKKKMSTVKDIINSLKCI